MYIDLVKNCILQVTSSRIKQIILRCVKLLFYLDVNEYVNHLFLLQRS